MCAAAILALAGCGGGGTDEDADALARGLARDVKALKRGEILIRGERSPRFSGPYRFGRAGYVLRYRQTGEPRAERRLLTVALESRRGSTATPYQLVVRTERLRGQARIRVSGELYIHVTTTSPSYELRFTPPSASG
jgi:hypothetical protein